MKVEVEVPEQDLETPPPRKRPAATSSRSKKDNPKGGKDGEGKKTFARRYRPATQHGACAWDALRSAYVATIAFRVVAPSKSEVGMFFKQAPQISCLTIYFLQKPNPVFCLLPSQLHTPGSHNLC